MNNNDLGRSVPDGLSSATPIEPVPISPVPASIPSAREPWAPFMELKAWKTGRRGEVLALVASGMELYRGYVANAQQEYEAHCAVLADFMETFTHLSTFIVSDAAAAFDEPAQATEARRAETHSGSVADESAVAKPCAQGDAARPEILAQPPTKEPTP